MCALACLVCLWLGADRWDQVKGMRGALASRACQPPGWVLRVLWGAEAVRVHITHMH